MPPAQPKTGRLYLALFNAVSWPFLAASIGGFAWLVCGVIALAFVAEWVIYWRDLDRWRAWQRKSGLR